MSEVKTDSVVNVSGDNDSGIDLSTNDVVAIKTADTERARVDASGNVGIGTTSPSLATASVSASGLEISGTVPAINLNAGSSDEFLIYGGASSGNILVANNNPLRFLMSGSERMRIDDNGRLLLRKTSGTVSGSCVEMERNMESGVAMEINDTDTSGTNNAIHFRRGGSVVGKITIGPSSTGYATSSDYRLKQGVEDMTGAIDRVKQLAPKRFNFIVDADTTVDGFLAHEAQTVVPEAVTGTHNEVDDDGNAVMQGIDQSKLVPLLTGALQEAIAKIEALEARVTALENA